MAKTPPSTTVTVAEAAFTLGLTYEQVRRLLLRHELQGTFVNRHYLVDRLDLKRYQEAHRS